MPQNHGFPNASISLPRPKPLKWVTYGLVLSASALAGLAQVLPASAGAAPKAIPQLAPDISSEVVPTPHVAPSAGPGPVTPAPPRDLAAPEAAQAVRLRPELLRTTPPAELPIELPTEPRTAPKAASITKSKTRSIWMEVTAYCACAKCCGEDAQGITASGKTVRHNRGRFVAADTRLLPFGTKVSIPGYNDAQTVEVIDRGKDIKGNRLDVFFPSHKTAQDFGRRWIKVTVTSK